MIKFVACEGVGVIENDVYPDVTTLRTDYARTEPMCLMLSRCDLAIIDKHKSENQDPRDFLQRLISENLRVLRDRTP